MEDRRLYAQAAKDAHLSEEIARAVARLAKAAHRIASGKNAEEQMGMAEQSTARAELLGNSSK